MTDFISTCFVNRDWNFTPGPPDGVPVEKREKELFNIILQYFCFVSVNLRSTTSEQISSKYIPIMINIRTSANLIVKNKIVLTFFDENYCYPPKENAQSSKIIIVTSIEYSSLSPPLTLLITLLSPFTTSRYHSSPTLHYPLPQPPSPHIQLYSTKLLTTSHLRSFPFHS